MHSFLYTKESRLGKVNWTKTKQKNTSKDNQPFVYAMHACYICHFKETNHFNARERYNVAVLWNSYHRRLVFIFFIWHVIHLFDHVAYEAYAF